GRLFAADFDPSAAVVLDAPPPSPAPASGPGEAPSATIVEDRTAAVDVRAAAPDTGGFLVLSDSFAPEWTAVVHGRPAPVLRANGLFRAVRIGPGEHTVRFTYVPRSFYVGGAVSVATVLALFVACALDRRRGLRA